MKPPRGEPAGRLSAPAVQEVQRLEQLVASLRAESAAIRERTREMHEYVQAARDTERALRAAEAEADSWLDMTTSNLDEQFTRFVTDRMDRAGVLIEKVLQATTNEVMADLKEVRRTIGDLEARALGCADKDDLDQRITDRVQEAVARPDYLQAIADLIMRTHGCDCPPGTHGMPDITAAMSGMRPHPNVRVRLARDGEAPGVYRGDRP